MSFSWNDGETRAPVAVVRGSTDKKLKNEVLYVSHTKDKDTFKNIELQGDMMFFPIPDVTLERSIVYAAGRSGSGKSYFCANWLKEYKKLYPDNEIYVFSLIDEDEKIDDIGVHRIKIDSDLVNRPLEITDFADSVVLFDDIDVIDNKKLHEAVYAIMNKILELGRHYHISTIITNHLLTNGKDTRRILNESQFICIFPASGSFGGISYMLKKYMGFDVSEIKRIKNTKSRWIYIRNVAPMCVLSSNDAYTMAGLSNDENENENKHKKR